MNSEELTPQLERAIGEVIDPDLEQPLSALGALHHLELADGTVHVFIEVVPPLYRTLARQLDAAIGQAVAHVAPELQCVVHARAVPVPRLVPTHLLPEVQDTVAVASGKGGVGKSTVAANLACSFMLEGLQTGLLDADIYGPSVPTLFGLEGATLQAESREGRIVGYPHQQYGIKVASMGFIMQRDQAAIFRGPMLAGYFRTLIEQIEWGELDVLVFDLPPGTGDVQLTLAQQVPLTGAVIVTTPQRLAVADVRRSIAMFRRVNVDVLGIIENMSYYVPPDQPGKRYYLFGEGGGEELAREAGVPFLGALPLHDDIRIGSDEGLPAVLSPEASPLVHEAFSTVVRNVLRQMRRVNAARRQQPSVEIRV